MGWGSGPLDPWPTAPLAKLFDVHNIYSRSCFLKSVLEVNGGHCESLSKADMPRDVAVVTNFVG